MNSLAIISVMLSAFIAEMAASTHIWPRQQKLTSKTKHEYKGCSCLNGGTCVSYWLFSRIKTCLCPKGYDGDHCEIDVETSCYTGDGRDYRGTESVNENGENCLAWDSHMLKRWPYNEHMENALELGLGRHNYCRNPDGQSKPWCYVRRGYRTSVTPCDIPACQKHAKKKMLKGDEIESYVTLHAVYHEVQHKSSNINFRMFIQEDLSKGLCG